MEGHVEGPPLLRRAPRGGSEHADHLPEVAPQGTQDQSSLPTLNSSMGSSIFPGDMVTIP